MTYADYKYYKDTFEGTVIPETLFPRCVNAASRHIDKYTFQRIQNPADIDGLKDCACEMAEAVYEIKYKNDGKVKKSENVDGYSVSYVTERQDGEMADTLLQSKLYSICSLYLMHTGLMYQGIESC